MSSPKKSIKQRNSERLKNKEYSRTYLSKKQARYEEPNNYPKTRQILIKDAVKSFDLYKALIFFFSVQIVIATISAGVKNPNLAGAMNLLALIIGAISITFAILEINRRQRHDPSRRAFRLSRVIKIVTVMLIALFASSFFYNFIGLEMNPQPNQMSLESLLTLFPVAMIFTMIVVSPITEEIVFRELLPFATGPSYLSFITSSIIFMVLHSPYGIMGWTSYGILAVGFLYARLKDNNVYTSIGVHMIWNAITIII